MSCSGSTRTPNGRSRSSGRLRHALFLPADETYFAVYDNTTVEAVRAATAVAARSRSPLDRIVRAVLLDPYPMRFVRAREATS